MARVHGNIDQVNNKSIFGHTLLVSVISQQKNRLSIQSKQKEVPCLSQLELSMYNTSKTNGDIQSIFR